MARVLGSGLAVACASVLTVFWRDLSSLAATLLPIAVIGIWGVLLAWTGCPRRALKLLPLVLAASTILGIVLWLGALALS
jgi:hypothetical protein